MKIRLIGEAEKQYPKLPAHIRKKADKQFKYLLEDIQYPSLDIKKYDKTINLYQGRIDQKYRFYFFIQHPDYIIVSMIKHKK